MNGFIILSLCAAVAFAQQSGMQGGHNMTPCTTPLTAAQCSAAKACMPAHTGGTGTHVKGATMYPTQKAQWQAMKSQMQACFTNAGVTNKACLKSCPQAAAASQSG